MLIILIHNKTNQA